MAVEGAEPESGCTWRPAFDDRSPDQHRRPVRHEQRRGQGEGQPATPTGSPASRREAAADYR